MKAEITKYIWTDCSANKVKILFLVLAFIFGICALQYGMQGLQSTSLTVAVLFGIWGIIPCSNSVSEEVIAGTWDQQRLSPQSAADLAFGKIIGAPLFQMLGMLLSIIVFVTVSGVSYTEEIRLVLLLIPGIFSLLAFAVMASIESAAAMRMHRRKKSGNSLPFFLVILIPVIGLVPALIRSNLDTIIIWWGVNLSLFSFLLLTAGFAMIWTTIGAYRAMLRELCFPTTPVFFGSFIIFLAFYLAPFLQSGNSIFQVSFNLFLISYLMAYGTLFAENKEAVSLQKLCSNIVNLKLSATQIPKSLVSLVLAITGLIACAICTIFFGSMVVNSTLFTDALSFQMITILFLFRDILIVLAIAFSRPNHRKNSQLTAFIFFSLYLMLPIGLAILNQKALLQLFWPDPTHNTTSSYVLAAIGMLAALRLFTTAYSKVRKRDC